MLKMRLQRVGRIHEPSFRLVLTDSKNSTKSGRFSEILGSYDPRGTNESLKEDRIKYWLSQGALPTDTVHNLLIKKNIINGKKVHVAAKSKKAPVEAPAAAPKPAETPAAAPIETPVESPAPEAPVEAAPVEAPVETPVEVAPEEVSTEVESSAPEGDIIEAVEEKAA